MVQPHTLSALSAQTGPAVLPSSHFIVATLGPGVGHFSGGHAFDGSGTHVQTDGELSKRVFVVHATFCTHEQIPPQSAPPLAGSQLSLGSSTHFPTPGQGRPANPPHVIGSATHLPPSQWVPEAHFTVAQGSVGGGLHWQVGQPFASSTFPFGQAMAHTGPHTGLTGTHAQTDGELSNLLFASHATFCTHWQIPPQSAPPLAGSQLSLGSSTHLPNPGQGLPAMPPHAGPAGGGLHAQVGQPLASRTLPYSQKILHTGGQTGPTGTQAQTEGELSNLLSAVHATFCTHEQIPPQSAPPLAGSQLSLGSSTHLPNPGQGLPMMPPHEGPAARHFPPSHRVPVGHSTAAHESSGGGLHLQVGQPWASSTLPYWQ
jgi:hypothetical protein